MGGGGGAGEGAWVLGGGFAELCLHVSTCCLPEVVKATARSSAVACMATYPKDRDADDYRSLIDLLSAAIPVGLQCDRRIQMGQIAVTISNHSLQAEAAYHEARRRWGGGGACFHTFLPAACQRW
jgi:hypothetical protein